MPAFARHRLPTIRRESSPDDGVAIRSNSHGHEGQHLGTQPENTVEEAIRVGTINGAYASYEENLKGSIEIGKLADLVVLGRDPFKENHSTLVTIPVERTMAGGRWTFES